MAKGIRAYGRSVVRILAPHSEKEREKRAAHAFALLLVAIVAIGKYVGGVTVPDTRFTLYGVAIAFSAARGGFAPAVVATLAAAAVSGLGAARSSSLDAPLMFAIEGIVIALTVSTIRSHVLETHARLRAADTRIAEMSVHDLARCREWDDYRETAGRAQAALQQAADDTREQLAALENLIDPSLNPLAGPEMVVELLERLRATVGADGAALVRPGRMRDSLFAARGLQPVSGIRTNVAQAVHLAPGRVALVHNDPAQVGRLSALDWPSDVTSLMIVPVVHDGRVWSTIEIASERSRRATDWDIALVRVVADRLAAVVVGDGASVPDGDR